MSATCKRMVTLIVTAVMFMFWVILAAVPANAEGYSDLTDIKADFNDNGTVDIDDLNLLIGSYGNGALSEDEKQYDLNQDNVVDLYDMAVLSRQANAGLSHGLKGNISISSSDTLAGKIASKNGEVTLSNPTNASQQGLMSSMTINPPNFEYDIRYVAQVMPVTVDSVTVDGQETPQTVTVQANDLLIDENRAFVSYNYRGATFAGAVQIIDISDAEKPRALNELKFNNMDINAVCYDKELNQLLFGGGADPSVFGTGQTSFIARVNVDNITVDDIINSITPLPSSCVTSISKQGNQYYVGVGAHNGAVVVLDGNMQQVGVRNINDVRDIESDGQGFVALTAGLKDELGGWVYPGKLISSLEDNSGSDIIVDEFSSPECKSTLALRTGGDKVLEDENALAFLALARDGFQVMKMGGVDHGNQSVYSLANPSEPVDSDTVGVAYDGGLAFLANGAYGFQVLRINGMAQDPVSGAKFIDPAQFAELVGYHQLSGGIYDGNYYHANNIAYKKRDIIRNNQTTEQNLLFVAVGDSGVNIYTLTNKNNYDVTPVPDETWDGIHQILVDTRPVQGWNSSIITADPNLRLLKDAQVNVVFVDENASYKNAVGCFVSTLSPSEISTASQIENCKQMVFENASKVDSGGSMVRGDSRLLSPNPINAGNYIGCYFRQNGYGNPNASQYYSIPALNPDSKGHYAIFVDDINQKIVIALEDLDNLGDKDFDDVIIILDIKPFNAVDISQLPKMSELLNQNNLTISSVAAIFATVNVGDTYIMPSTVTATMSNGITSQVAVTWEPAQIDTSTAGLKVATGVVAGFNGTVELKVQVNPVGSSAKSIGLFSFEGLNPVVNGVIDEEAGTIAVNVPYGCNLTNLVPTISVSDGASVSPASGVAQDFTNTVTYKVTASDGTSRDYLVNVIVPTITSIDETASIVNAGETYTMPATVTANLSDDSSVQLPVTWVPAQIDTSTPGLKEAAGTVEGYSGTILLQVNVIAVTSSEKSILLFDFNGLNPIVKGVIDESTGTIEVDVPYGTDLTALVPTLEISPAASVIPLSDVAQDFTSPVDYEVTAENGSTRTYTVNVRVPEILSVDQISAVVDEGADYTMPAAVTANLSDGSRIQLPVQWTPDQIDTSLPGLYEASGMVTGYSGTVLLQVRVTPVMSNEKAIRSFSFATITPVCNGIIDEEAGTISVNVPLGTDITSLAPSIEVSAGAACEPASEQSQDFTNPLTYVVTAENGTTRNYVVTVSIPVITSVDPISATIQAGKTYTMPTTVTANLSDGSTLHLPVTWDPEQIDTSTPGLKEATGTVTGYSGTVLLQLEIIQSSADADLDRIADVVYANFSFEGMNKHWYKNYNPNGWNGLLELVMESGTTQANVRNPGKNVLNLVNPYSNKEGIFNYADYLSRLKGFHEPYTGQLYNDFIPPAVLITKKTAYAYDLFDCLAPGHKEDVKGTFIIYRYDEGCCFSPMGDIELYYVDNAGNKSGKYLINQNRKEYVTSGR
ncbi:MAG: Ig-like domain-containing protein [Syntrophomonadaceae bacterium]|nr:Ig-like domain-containing protein [Syntrophomonadaceae bacterium]